MKINKKLKYIAGISGGPDSMALLDKYKDVIKVVCHVNYHKREDSDHDMNIVANYCQRNNIIFECLSLTSKDYDKQTINNFQSLARNIRYNFFHKIATKYNILNLLIAHQFDDFLETAFMQQNKKSLNFFYGIKKINCYKNMTIYRPLISKTKINLLKYCQKRQIAYAIDWTNTTDLYDRNKVRKYIQNHSWIWKKVKYFKFKIKNFFDHFTEKKVKKIYSIWKKSNFSITFFKKVKKNLLDNLIYFYLKDAKIKDINFGKINNLKTFIFSQKNDKTNRIQKNLFVMKINDTIKVIKLTK